MPSHWSWSTNKVSGMTQASPLPFRKVLEGALVRPTPVTSAPGSSNSNADLISPKTARNHSISVHVVAGVDAGLSFSFEEVAKHHVQVTAKRKLVP